MGLGEIPEDSLPQFLFFDFSFIIYNLLRHWDGSFSGLAGLRAARIAVAFCRGLLCTLTRLIIERHRASVKALHAADIVGHDILLNVETDGGPAF